MIKRILWVVAVVSMSGCSWLVPQTAMDVASADESIRVLTEAQQQMQVTAEAAPLAVPVVVEPEVSGPRFNLEVDDVPAQTFFRGLVHDTPFNMVVHPQVKGRISLTLQDVNVGEVMNVMRDVYGYDYTLEGSVYQVYPDALRTEVFQLNYLNLSRSGQSEVQVSAGKVSDSQNGNNTSVDASRNNGFVKTSSSQQGGQVVGTIVSTQADSDLWNEVTATLDALVAMDEGSHVMVTPQVGLIVVKAKPASLRAVRQYLDQVESSVSRQVILEAKIIEVTLNEGFEAGIDWHTFGDASAGSFRPVAVEQPDGSTILVGGSEHGVAGELVSGVSDFFNPLGAGFTLSASVGDFDATLDLLATQGSVQVLSSPRIATVNNQKAVIKVGSDEFFVTDISSNTVTAGSAINVNDSPELTPFFSGIALDVTPQISSEEDVILHVHPTVSEVVEQRKEIGGQVVPLAASTIRESDSIVRARSGQIIVIGGLMQNNAKDQGAEVPWFGRIPLIGHLFRQRSRTAIKRELVILLRPVVVDKGVQQSFMFDSAERARKIRDRLVN